MRTSSLADRFWPKVLKSDGCWPWLANRLKSGYGRIRYERRDRLAHRTAWELTNGPIPDGLYVCHDNMHDMKRKGRWTVRDMAGGLNPNVKLTPDCVRAIRRDPRPLHIISTQYGVSLAAIGNIRRRHSWKHID